MKDRNSVDRNRSIGGMRVSRPIGIIAREIDYFFDLDTGKYITIPASEYGMKGMICVYRSGYISSSTIPLYSLTVHCYSRSLSQFNEKLRKWESEIRKYAIYFKAPEKKETVEKWKDWPPKSVEYENGYRTEYEMASDIMDMRR